MILDKCFAKLSDKIERLLRRIEQKMYFQSVLLERLLSGQCTIHCENRNKEPIDRVFFFSVLAQLLSQCMPL